MMKKSLITFLFLCCAAVGFAQKTSRPQKPNYDSIRVVYKEKIQLKKLEKDSFVAMKATLLSDSIEKPMRQRDFAVQRKDYHEEIHGLRKEGSIAVKMAIADYEKRTSAYDKQQPYYKYKQRERGYRTAAVISSGLSLALFAGNLSYSLLQGLPNQTTDPEGYKRARNTQIAVAYTSVVVGASSLSLGVLSSINKHRFTKAISLAAHTDWLPNNTVLPSFGFAINF